jgi:hypothetical protein
MHSCVLELCVCAHVVEKEEGPDRKRKAERGRAC